MNSYGMGNNLMRAPTDQMGEALRKIVRNNQLFFPDLFARSKFLMPARKTCAAISVPERDTF